MVDNKMKEEMMREELNPNELSDEYASMEGGQQFLN